jgi:hypothetical protein
VNTGNAGNIFPAFFEKSLTKNEKSAIQESKDDFPLMKGIENG